MSAPRSELTRAVDLARAVDWHAAHGIKGNTLEQIQRYLDFGKK